MCIDSNSSACTHIIHVDLALQAYTSQIVVLTMMALALSEDSIAKRARRDAIIASMAALPDTLREVRAAPALATGRSLIFQQPLIARRA